MNDMIRLSAVELVARAQSGALRVIDIIEAHIAQIERVNARLNAVVTPLYDAARTEARAADDRRASGAPLPPLFGLPVTIKDSLDVAGAAASCGMVARRDRIAAEDAVVVADLRRAGAIVIAKTNTPEACWAQETTNLLYGRTQNPWDTSRTVGGSTGGEAAIIAACGSALGLGSDISGSIRLPAAFTGIVGLRPTSMTLDETGHYPLVRGRLAQLEAVGPMARRVEDVALAFAVLSHRPYTPPDPAILHGQRISFWTGGGAYPAEHSIRHAVIAAVSALKMAGMEVTKRHIPARIRFAQIGWMAMIDDDARADIDRMFMQPSVWAEMRNWRNGKPTIAAEALSFWSMMPLTRIAERVFDAPQWRERLHRQIVDWIGDGGVIVCPIHPTVAPKHGWQRGTPLLTLPYQQWVNLAGLPGLTVPTGNAPNGMPTAVQIVGTRGSEATVLAAGMIVQQALMPEWTPPPSLNA
ncbi:MAG: amidase [Chloroflexota bacterium]|nr:amidase [Chloroflexota bacterium]